MDQSVLEREPVLEAATTTTAVATVPRVRRRRRRPEPRPAWSCENCTSPNLGRRRRCHDCGTTRD